MQYQELTKGEIKRIQELCFANPVKACSTAQLIIDTCQIMSCTDYANIKEKKKRNILYKAKSLVGIAIGKRKFISLIQ